MRPNLREMSDLVTFTEKSLTESIFFVKRYYVKVKKIALKLIAF